MRRLFFTVLIVVALPGVAFAQPMPPKMATGQGPVSSFAQLNTQLKVGDTVWVIDATGHEFEGKVRALDSGSLTLEQGDGRKFTEGVVKQIHVRRSDSLLNGLLIGMAGGAGVGYATGDGESLWSRSNGLWIGAAVGAGVGLAIDAAWNGKRELVYGTRAGRTGPSLTIGPIIAPRVQGVAIRWTF
jgi:hypothetical protein